MSSESFHRASLTRRQTLTLGGAGLLGGVATSALPRTARADNQAPVGTWPAGVSGDTAFIGLDPPLTGPYSVPGQDELKGYELAIAHLNDGNDLIKKMAPKVTKGLLGKKVIYGTADSEFEAERRGAESVALHFR